MKEKDPIELTEEEKKEIERVKKAMERKKEKVPKKEKGKGCEK